MLYAITESVMATVLIKHPCRQCEVGLGVHARTWAQQGYTNPDGHAEGQRSQLLELLATLER